MISDLLDLTSLPLIHGLLQIWPHRPYIVINLWIFWIKVQGLKEADLGLEAESDPKLHNLKSDSTQVFVGLRKNIFWNLLRKWQIASAEDSVEPIWIKQGSFSVLTLTNMISFIKGLARLSFSQLIKFSNPEKFLPLRFQRSVQKVLKNLGQCNEFEVQ